MLLDVFKDHNKKVATLVGNEYAVGTYIRYQTSLKHTLNYLHQNLIDKGTSIIRIGDQINVKEWKV